MAQLLSREDGHFIIHTGNILNINEVKMKAGQNPTEELVESLKSVIRSINVSYDEAYGDTLEASKVADYHLLNLSGGEDRKDVKVGVKVFVRQYDAELITAAMLADVTEEIEARTMRLKLHMRQNGLPTQWVEKWLKSLKTTYIESVVLALRADNPLSFEALQNAWKALEQFSHDKKVLSIGVSDIETDVFIALYEWAKVKPAIVQINLAHCCVVPPVLQSFTRAHEVQLLTHSDPIDILPDKILAAAFAELELPLAKRLDKQVLLWATRYQIHIKCRGVLSSKGYIISLTEDI